MTENAPSPKPVARARRAVGAALPWVVGVVGFLVLAGAIAYVGLQPRPVLPAPDLTPITERIANLAGTLGTVEHDLGSVQTKLAAVEQKLASPPPVADVAPIEKRLDALEKRITALAERPAAPEATPDVRRSASLTAGSVTDEALATALAPLRTRLATLEAKEARANEADVARAALESGQAKALATLEASTAALTKSQTELAHRLDALTRLTRATAARAALRNGQPLGVIPGAPPALARYATTAPPTLASLRLAFDGAARAELAAGPSGGDRGFVGQMRARLGSLLTVREGDKVIVGNPEAGAIAKARGALEAGDLPGALAALGALSPPLTPAMAAWIDNARGLLAAETALSSLGEPG